MSISSTSSLAAYDGNAVRRLDSYRPQTREASVASAVRDSRHRVAPAEQVIEGEVINKPRDTVRSYQELSGREFLQQRRLHEQLSGYASNANTALRHYQSTARFSDSATAGQVDIFV